MEWVTGLCPERRRGGGVRMQKGEGRGGTRRGTEDGRWTVVMGLHPLF